MRSAVQDIDEINEYCSMDFVLSRQIKLKTRILVLKNEWKINIRSKLFVSDFF